jgi:DinB superfamily
MQIERNQLIDDLISITDRSSLTVKKFKHLSADQLNFKRRAEEWSVLECIEHLNLYGDFYLPELEKQILAQEQNPEATVFKSGTIGNYFTNLMQVKNGKLKKMKSPKDKNPIGSTLSPTTLDRFLKQQEKLKSLLLQAKKIDLTKARTSISLTNLIRLRLGDTFRFFVYHIERHVAQAKANLSDTDIQRFCHPEANLLS